MNAKTGEGHSKCLLLGGYLVLARESTALCVSLKPKVVCRAVAVEDSHAFQVLVETLPKRQSFTFSRETIANPGPFERQFERFVLAALHVFFSVVDLPSFAISLSVEGDKEFYTESGKTGLGSSAATVVAVVRAMFALLGGGDDSTVFKVASVAHSLAQGHVGSCFDISCAVFGTQIFRRPSPNLLSVDHVRDAWDNEWHPVTLPPNLAVSLLATPFQGSSTPGLVRMFQEKAQSDQETYDLLKRTVENAIQVFQSGDIKSISTVFRQVRGIQRRITLEWGVGVVPDEIEELALKVEQLAGVVAVVVPGAGGYDSIAVITERQPADFSSLNLTVLATTE